MIELLTSLFGAIVNKILELKSEKVNIAIEVEYFAFGKWNNDTPALCALVEVTNLSDAPYSLSRFILRIGKTEFKNTLFTSHSIVAEGSHAVALFTDHARINFDDLPVDCFDPIKNPYLKKNQSVIGIILFNLASTAEKQLSGNSFELVVKISGNKERPSVSIV